ncbi:MAG: ABC transporter substrate-binding protein [Deltaproteobacteria bacterium]|nr:ABC transporter substrate-binding protein [Deltaproteobacteria bacterium]
MKTLLSVLIIAVVLPFPFYDVPLGAASTPTKLVITYAVFSEREGALFVARDQGFFRKHGLDVQLVYVNTASVALSALARGDSHLNTGSTSGAILGAMAGGLDLVFVAGLVNKLTGAFVVAPEIKTPMDLKGKTIGVTSIGGGNWVFTMLALEHWGIDPKRDGISIRVIGNEAVRSQAVASGNIDGATFNHTFAYGLKRQGYRILADLSELGIPYQGTTVFARRSLVDQSPEVVEKVLTALVEAIAFIQDPANKAPVMKSLAKGLYLPRAEDAAEGYEIMKTLYERRIYPTVEGIQNAIRLLGTTNEKIRGLKAEDVIDDRIVKKLEQKGLFQPGPK